MNLRRCDCGLVLHIKEGQTECPVCKVLVSAMKAVPTTPGNIKEALFWDLVGEIGEDIRRHPEEYRWLDDPEETPPDDSERSMP